MKDGHITMGDGFRFAAGVWLFTLVLLLLPVVALYTLGNLAVPFAEGIRQGRTEQHQEQPAATWKTDRYR